MTAIYCSIFKFHNNHSRDPTTRLRLTPDPTQPDILVSPRRLLQVPCAALLDLADLLRGRPEQVAVPAHLLLEDGLGLLGALADPASRRGGK